MTHYAIQAFLPGWSHGEIEAVHSGDPTLRGIMERQLIEYRSGAKGAGPNTLPIIAGLEDILGVQRTVTIEPGASVPTMAGANVSQQQIDAALETLSMNPGAGGGGGALAAGTGTTWLVLGALGLAILLLFRRGG